MHKGTEASIAQLLRETNAAHGEYETTVLEGVYDEDWSSWYATYLIEHGLIDLVPHAGEFDAVELGAALKQLDADQRRELPGSDWPVYYAERLGAKVEEIGSKNPNE